MPLLLQLQGRVLPVPVAAAEMRRPPLLQLPLLLLLALVGPASGASPLDSIPDGAWRAPGRKAFVQSRLSIANRTLELDGVPVLLRGATYSPTPIGKIVGSSEPALRIADFFEDANSGIWQRDLPLMRRMGMNAVRVYELNAGDHTAFLDMAYALNITVFAGFPLFNDIHDLRDTTSAASPGELNYGDLSLQVGGALAHAWWRDVSSGS